MKGLIITNNPDNHYSIRGNEIKCTNKSFIQRVYVIFLENTYLIHNI